MKITDAFLGEHAVFYAQFTECENNLDAADLPAIKRAAAVIASALESHAHLEDRLLFTPLAVAAADQALIFQLMEEEHRTIAELLAGIGSARDADRAREQLFEMIAAARSHFLKEEQIAFPLAEQLLASDELQRRGREWAETRQVALQITADS